MLFFERKDKLLTLKAHSNYFRIFELQEIAMKDYWKSLSTGRKIRLVANIVLGILALIFAIRNWQSTEVILVFIKMKLPLTLIILVCLAIGFGLASLFDYKKFKKKDQEISGLKSRIEQLLKDKGDSL